MRAAIARVLIREMLLEKTDCSRGPGRGERSHFGHFTLLYFNVMGEAFAQFPASWNMR